MWEFLFTVIAILVAYWFLVATKLPREFPPGPRFPLPILGNTYQLGWCLKTGIDKLVAKYGDVFGFYLGRNKAIVISDYELLKEIGSKTAFQDRVNFNSMFELYRGGLVKSGNDMTSPGIFFSNGPAWVEQKRFSLHHLKNLGLGKRSLENVILGEVEDLCDYLEDNTITEADDVKFSFTAAVINSFWNIVCGQRLGYKDKRIIELTSLISGAFQQQSVPMKNYQVLNLYKSIVGIRKKMSNSSGFKIIFTLNSYMDEVVTEHEKTFQEENLRDFTDHYLNHIKDTHNANSSFFGSSGRLSLINILTDFFLAGIESTSTTLRWGMLYMILHPDIQKNVQDELDKVTGGSRLPNLEDRPNTPYTEATLHEIQRVADITPLSFAHCLNDDVKLAGYTIPKGTVIIPHLSNIHNNPKIFLEPEQFNPSRFIGEDGKFKPHPKVIPFGIGKRKCLGESLARMSLYLFFTGILSRFTIGKDETEENPTTERIYGLSTSPKPFKIQFRPRKSSNITGCSI